MAAKQDSGLFLWLVSFVFSLLAAFSLALISPDYARHMSASEAQKIESMLGINTLLKINDIAGSMYRSTMDDIDIGAISKSLEQADDEQAGEETKKRFFNMKGVARWIKVRTEAFLDLTYWFFRRITLFVIWMPLWIPMLFIAMMHGYWDREIKKTNFGYTSPVRNQAARRGMRFITMLVMLFFVVPVALDPIIFPFCMMGATILTGTALGNVQKRI